MVVPVLMGHREDRAAASAAASGRGRSATDDARLLSARSRTAPLADGGSSLWWAGLVGERCGLGGGLRIVDDRVHQRLDGCPTTACV